MRKLKTTIGGMKDKREHHGLFTGAEKGHRETDAQFHFTGIKKYFNSYILTGRMNCALAIYGGIASMFLYFKLRSKKNTGCKSNRF
ncbi:unnamed protein product [Nyctereutes procyonoides]|uniref:(raccoon dog) hypothetical protein n=1 Tax=Nyctereutes procyonoides TaxID=34880 RepID=A0A812A097_NYCPR|nr:unnamed protein product [Nyctereutes procyonoides]